MYTKLYIIYNHILAQCDARAHADILFLVLYAIDEEIAKTRVVFLPKLPTYDSSESHFYVICRISLVSSTVASRTLVARFTLLSFSC